MRGLQNAAEPHEGYAYSSFFLFPLGGRTSMTALCLDDLPADETTNS